MTSPATPDPSKEHDPGFVPPSQGPAEEAFVSPSQTPTSSQPPSPQFGAYGVAPAGTLPPQAPASGSSSPGDSKAYAPSSQPYSQSYSGTYPPQTPGYPPAGGGYGSYAGYQAAPGTMPGGVFSVAPKPGIIPLRPLGIGEIISGAFESLRSNPKAMFVPSLAVLTIVGIISALITYLTTNNLAQEDILNSTTPTLGIQNIILGSTQTSILSDLTPLLLMSLCNTILSGLLIVAVSRSVLGRIASPGEVWRRTKGRIFALIGQSILISLINLAIILIVLVVVGIALAAIFASSDNSGDGTPTSFIVAAIAILVVLVLGGIFGAFFWVRLSMSSAALMLENIGVLAGIRRSWQLTRSYFWRVFGILLLSALITGVASGAINGIMTVFVGVGSFMAPAHSAIAMAIYTLVTTLLTALVLPFSSAVSALTYIDLRMRREGLDVELRQAAA